MTLDVRLVDFKRVTRASRDDADGEADSAVARFTASFELAGYGAVVVPGWHLVRIGPERYCLNAPNVSGPDQHEEPVVIPQGWTMRLLARAIWRYTAGIDPEAVEHLGAALRADLGLLPSGSEAGE